VIISNTDQTDGRTACGIGGPPWSRSSLILSMYWDVCKQPSTGHRGSPREEPRLLRLIARTSRCQIRMDPSSVMVQPGLCATSQT
jgi:hypothetical protein